MNKPSVYVGTYRKYNEGSIAGGWISLTECKDYSDFIAKCRQLHKDESDPEFMIQDLEDFPDGLSCGEWIGESDFNDIIQASQGEDKPIIRIVNYSERAIAVVGDTKPIKEHLKEIGGRFNAKLSCGAGWIFSIKKKADIERLLADTPVAQAETSDAKDELFEFFCKEYEKVWKNDLSMLEYKKKYYSGAIRLSNGGILEFVKPSIETSFCFGYSDFGQGMSYTEAKRAEKAASSEKYFLQQNLKEFDRKIKGLSSKDDCSTYDWYIERVSYNGNKLNVWRLAYMNISNVDNKYGEYEILAPADREAVINGLKNERKKFEKRLHTYLKRYGTSKLRTWTYWVDE